MDRKDEAPPLATSEWGWKYHHLGIPTTAPVEGEVYLPGFKMHVAGFSTSPFGIEWMRFEADSPVHELIRKVPHIAFEVKDIQSQLKKHKLKVLTEPNSPSEGVIVAMIEHNGAPIELIEFLPGH